VCLTPIEKLTAFWAFFGQGHFNVRNGMRTDQSEHQASRCDPALMAETGADPRAALRNQAWKFGMTRSLAAAVTFKTDVIDMLGHMKVEHSNRGFVQLKSGRGATNADTTILESYIPDAFALTSMRKKMANEKLDEREPKQCRQFATTPLWKACMPSEARHILNMLYVQSWCNIEATFEDPAI
jgi:hypothetical protein